MNLYYIIHKDMGIKDLIKTCEKTFGYSPKKVQLEDLKNKYVAIDTSLYMYRAKYSDNDCLRSFMTMIYKLLSNEIIPIFIFDGVSTNLKDAEKMKRKQRNEKIKIEIDKCNEVGDICRAQELSRQVIQIKEDDFRSLRSLFDYLCIGYDTIHDHEAEGFCAHLNKNGYVHYVMTEDTDVIPYGALYWLRGYSNSSNEMQLYSIKNIRKSFNYNTIRKSKADYFYDDPTKFVNYCICLGTDFNKRLMTPLKAHKELLYYTPEETVKYMKLKFPDYDNIFNEISGNNFNNIDLSKYQVLKTMEPKEMLSKHISIKMNIPGLLEYLNKNKLHELMNHARRFYTIKQNYNIQ